MLCHEGESKLSSVQQTILALLPATCIWKKKIQVTVAELGYPSFHKYSQEFINRFKIERQFMKKNQPFSASEGTLSMLRYRTCSVGYVTPIRGM